MRNSPLISAPMVWLLLGILSAASMEYYVAEIWSSGQPAHFSDLYAPWWGAHELLLHGRNPYSPEVAHEIQNVIYGASVNSTAEDPLGIGGGFAYPPHAALLLWPTIHMSFPAAQGVFISISILATLLSVALWLRALRFPWSPLIWLTVALFTVGSFPALQGIKLENLSLIAAAFIAITVSLLAADHLVLSGIFLAVSTFKPQFTIALIPWLAIWTLSDWRRRRLLAWSFLTTMLLLVLFSRWLVPGWISSFLHIIRAYRRYTYGHSLLDVWFTPTWGPWIGASLLLLTLAFSWRHRSQSADSARFLSTVSLLLAVTLVVIPTLAPHAQLLLLPGFLCLLRDRFLLRSSGPLARTFLAAAWALLAWPWIAALGMLLAAVQFSTPALLRFWEVPLYTSPLLPFAVATALGCFVRARQTFRPSPPAPCFGEGLKPTDSEG